MSIYLRKILYPSNKYNVKKNSTIFTTIKNDISNVNQEIGLFGKSISEIKDIIYDVQTKGFKEGFLNKGTIDLAAYQKYNNLLDLGVSSEKALAEATKNTNTETIRLLQSANGAKVSTEALTAAQKASTLVAKAQSVAFKAVSMAGNMLVMALVTKGIELAASAIDHLVNKSKYAAEAMEEAQQEITDSQNKLKEVSDTVSENKDRFLELAQGVDQFSNNVSLSKDDYQEYLDISNKLADIAPDLVTGYDEQGNALLVIGSNANDTSKKLQDIIDKQQTIANQKLVDNLPKIADGIYNEVEDAKIEIDSLQGQLEDAKNTSKNLNIDIKGSHGRIDFKDNDYEKYGKGMEKALKSAGIDYEKVAGGGLYETSIQLKSASKEQLEQAQKFYDAWLDQENAFNQASINGLEKSIAQKQGMLKQYYAKITPNLQQWAKQTPEYEGLGQDSANIVDKLIPQINWDSLKDRPINDSDYTQYIENHIIKPLMTIPDEHKDEINSMFQKLLSFDDGDLNVLDFAKQLQEKLNDYGIKIDITPIIANEQNAKKTLSKSIDKISGTSREDQQKLNEYTKDFNASQIEAWNSATIGAKGADEAIQEYEQSIQQAKTDTEELGNTLADINKTKSGIGGLFDKYEQNEGYLTQDEVASVLETNPEYIQYLVKVGDQYKLNEQALNDWNEANKEQEQEINNQMGGNDYLGNYSSLLDSIQDNASHPNGGVGNTNIGSQLDDLINKNKEWNTSLQNGEITTAQYFQNMSNAITDSGLEDALHSLNGTFDDSTDYIEETVSVLTTQLSDGLTQSTKRFEEGQTSVQDYIKEINAGSDAEKKLLASTYNLDISQETGKASLDGLSDSALEAAQSYNSLVDSQNALASTSGFVDVLSQNADFLSQYTDEAGNLMDSIFDDSRFNDYVSNMSNSIVDFANQNADTMDQTVSWLADTAGISVEQASSIIAQGGDAVQGAVGNSLSGVQSMTSYAMSQVGSATSNAASAVGNVLTSLGNMISNFSYKITAKPFMQGKSKMAWDPKKGLDVSLPTFGFDISGSGGKSVSAFATSIKNAGSAISKYGASQSASAAFNNINSYKPKNTLSANKPSSYRPTYKPKSSGKSGSGGSGGSGGKNSGGDAEKQNEEYLDKFMAYQKALLEAGKITYQQYSQYVSDELERMYKNGKISASKYYSAVKDMIDEQKSIYDAALKGVTKLLDDEIDKWKDKIDVIEKNNDKLNEQKDKYDSILSAIQKVYDDEIKKANKKKDSIQDVIDAMSDENDEYERQKKLQEAIYNLNKANSQKTKYLLKDGQFVYSTDNSAIRDAQDSLHDAQYDVDVANLKKQQDDIDNYIDTLNEFKDKWNEISDAFSDAQDAMNLKQYLGSEYQRIILSNNLADIENFKNQYVAVESQINSNEQLKTSYEEKVDYYNNLKQQWEDCTSKYDDEKNKLYASQILGANWEAEVLSGRQQTLANFTSEYEKLCQRQADATVNAYNTEVQAAKNAAAGIASVSSSVASSGGGSSSGGSSGGSSSSTHKVTYDKNNNPNKPALKSNDYWTYEKLSKKGYSTSGQASSQISNYASKGANGFTQIGNKYFIVKWIANAGSPANASKAKNKLEKDNPKKKGKYGYAKRYHKGLELGKIKALPKDKAFDLVQDVGTNGLEADEVPIIAQKGEAVLTEEQIENLAKTLHLVPVQNEIMEKMSKISLGDLPMNTPKMNFDAGKVGQNVTKNNFAPSITLNLNCPNVSSVSDAKAITNVVDKQLNKFANDFYQASLHYINRK